jgi:TonB family protein
MHDCEATQTSLMDLLFDELGEAERPALLAELEACAACRGQHHALSATLSAFDTAAAEVLPGEEFWAGYGERLRGRMAQEIRSDIWQQGAAAFGLPRAEYRLTFLEDEGLARRLTRELRAAARESRLTWPEFKRDPFGFTRRSAVAYSRLAYRFFSQRNVALAGLTAVFFVTLAVGAIFAVENRCSVLGLFSRPCQLASAGNPYRDLKLVGMLPEAEIPKEQERAKDGPAGTHEGRGGGSKPEYQRPQGGGGGGRGEQLQASAGKLPTTQLAPVILPPSPHPPAVKRPSLPTPVTIDVDPALIKPDLRDVPYGEPDSNSTVASSGPGSGGGIGTGGGGGVGSGDGGGRGPGRGGNIGGGVREPGGGGPGGGGGGNPPVDYLRTFRPHEVTQRARIISKPEPGFTEDARRENVTGLVRLRAILSATGEVRSISVVKGLPGGLTEKAIAAARAIRFQPAQKDGRAVSQWVTLEYNFNIY